MPRPIATTIMMTPNAWEKRSLSRARREKRINTMQRAAIARLTVSEPIRKAAAMRTQSTAGAPWNQRAPSPMGSRMRPPSIAWTR